MATHIRDTIAGKGGIGKAWKLTKTLQAMGITSWHRVEPGNLMMLEIMHFADKVIFHFF